MTVCLALLNFHDTMKTVIAQSSCPPKAYMAPWHSSLAHVWIIAFRNTRILLNCLLLWVFTARGTRRICNGVCRSGRKLIILCCLQDSQAVCLSSTQIISINATIACTWITIPRFCCSCGVFASLWTAAQRCQCQHCIGGRPSTRKAKKVRHFFLLLTVDT